jgi:hypothetical protein
MLVLRTDVRQEDHYLEASFLEIVMPSKHIVIRAPARQISHREPALDERKLAEIQMRGIQKLGLTTKRS